MAVSSASGYLYSRIINDMTLSFFIFLGFFFPQVFYAENHEENYFLMFIYLLLRERERRGKRGRQRIPSRLCTAGAEPHTGLKLMNREIMT